MGLIAASLPGLAALGALLFTWMQVNQSTEELRISEHGQITTRFNSAISNLGSKSMDVRLGGIYALGRIMQDSARDQPTIISVLTAFAERHAGSSKRSLAKPLPEEYVRPAADVRAAMATLAHRRPEHDGGATIDLSATDLRGLRFTENLPTKFPRVTLVEADLRIAALTGADLRGATLHGANLNSADLQRANLRGARMWVTNLVNANVAEADLRNTAIVGADWTDAFAPDADFRGANLFDSNLSDALMDDADFRGADLTNAKLRDASLMDADLRGADLTDSDLSNADLTGADFRGAKLTGVDLEGAIRTGARGLPQKG